MKKIEKLTDELPETIEGLKEYVNLMEKAIKPVRISFNRMDTLLKEAKARLKRKR